MKNFDGKTAACIAALLVLAACGFFIFVRPGLSEYFELSRQLEAVNQQLDPKLLNDQQAQARYELETARKKAGDDMDVFYPQMSDSEFNGLLRRLLGKQLLTLNSLVLTPYVPVKNANVALLANSDSPLSPDAPNALMRRTAELRVTGEYASILAFIDSVNQIDICFGIDSATIYPEPAEPLPAKPVKPVKNQPSPSPAPNVYQAQITIRLYSAAPPEQAFAE